jgi:glucose-6-phosphate dehydrogenase assembly protein OpcA
VIVTLPDTSPTEIDKALVDLREKGGAVALSRVLNLVVVVPDERVEPAIEAANDASHEHPCRVLAVVLGDGRGRPRVDGEIRVGGDAGASEVLVLHASGPLTQHPAALVTPLLLSDSPVVAWWPGEAPPVPADDLVGRLATRRITDVAGCRRPRTVLAKLAAGYQPGDTDFAWARITRWRAVLASALDQRPGARVRQARVVGAASSPSADLLAGWLALALRVPVRRERPRGVHGVLSAHLELPDGWVDLARPEPADVATLTFPGTPGRPVALPHRSDAECLAEELRRLDADEVLGDVLRHGLPAVASSRRPAGSARRAHTATTAPTT